MNQSPVFSVNLMMVGYALSPLPGFWFVYGALLWLSMGWIGGYLLKTFWVHPGTSQTQLDWPVNKEREARWVILAGPAGLLAGAGLCIADKAWRRPAHYEQTGESWFSNPGPAPVATTTRVDLLKQTRDEIAVLQRERALRSHYPPTLINPRSTVSQQSILQNAASLKYADILASYQGLFPSTPPASEQAPAPTPLPTEDDKLGYVTAYRSWTLAGLGVLLSQGKTPWPFRQALVAQCTEPSEGVPHDNHFYGSTSYVCGVHGKMEPMPDVGIVGTVALWGKVIEHETGYRAEFAYPIAITAVRCWSCHQQVGADAVWLNQSISCSLGCAAMENLGYTARDVVPAAEVLGPLSENYGIEVPA